MKKAVNETPVEEPKIFWIEGYPMRGRDFINGSQLLRLPHLATPVYQIPPRHCKTLHDTGLHRLTPSYGECTLYWGECKSDMMSFLVPKVWIEQTTYRLQGGCSTAELLGRFGGDGRICTYSPEGTDLQSAAPRCLRRIPLIGDQYRVVVWVAGFEPAASAFRERPSTGLTIHPEIVGRGRAVCMMTRVYMGCWRPRIPGPTRMDALDQHGWIPASRPAGQWCQNPCVLALRKIPPTSEVEGILNQERLP